MLEGIASPRQRNSFTKVKKFAKAKGKLRCYEVEGLQKVEPQVRLCEGVARRCEGAMPLQDNFLVRSPKAKLIFTEANEFYAN